jgi:hypothetical protein
MLNNCQKKGGQKEQMMEKNSYMISYDNQLQRNAVNYRETSLEI